MYDHHIRNRAPRLHIARHHLSCWSKLALWCDCACSVRRFRSFRPSRWVGDKHTIGQLIMIPVIRAAPVAELHLSLQFVLRADQQEGITDGRAAAFTSARSSSRSCTWQYRLAATRAGSSDPALSGSDKDASEANKTGPSALDACAPDSAQDQWASSGGAAGG